MFLLLFRIFVQLEVCDSYSMFILNPNSHIFPYPCVSIMHLRFPYILACTRNLVLHVNNLKKILQNAKYFFPLLSYKHWLNFV